MIHNEAESIIVLRAASLSLSLLTYVSPYVYFSQCRPRLRFHGNGLRNRSVGGEGMCVIQGEIHLPTEPGHVSEPRAPRPSAHPESQWLVSQRLEEQQQPALLLQGAANFTFTLFMSPQSCLWFIQLKSFRSPELFVSLVRSICWSRSHGHDISVTSSNLE